MFSRNIAAQVAKSIAIDSVGDFFYFPLWWYTSGLYRMITNATGRVLDTADHLAIRLLLLNIFKPMFAQYDRAGRVISFFMRLIILLVRLMYLVVFSLLQALLVIVWIVAPAVIIARLLGIYFGLYVGG